MDAENPDRVYDDLFSPLYPQLKLGVIHGKLLWSFIYMLKSEARMNHWGNAQLFQVAASCHKS